MLNDPPPGWTELQKKAKRVKDPVELAAIIDEMNRLLTDYEKGAIAIPAKVARPGRAPKSSAQKKH